MLLESGSTVYAALAALSVGAMAWVWRKRHQAALAVTAEPPDSGASQVRKRLAPDALTGLPSRAEFEGALREAGEAIDRDGGSMCVLCIGVDNFQDQNEIYGRDIGDFVLRTVGERIRSAAMGRYPVARLGGTDFLLAVAGDIDSGRHMANQLVADIAQPIAAQDQSITVSCSIGMATYPKHGALSLIMGHACTAMRAARQGGGHAHAEFVQQMGSDQREMAELARDLRNAIEHNELMLYYQPKVDAVSLQITAAEALLRWQHPTRGIVSPAVFIPIAERSGLICAIGNWVIDEATRQAATWLDSGLRMRVAINVSGYQMRQDDFVDRLGAALARHGLAPGRFTCEITETVAMEDTQVTQLAFTRLGQLGVHVSIDDFGTGHSSLALLRRLPAAELKIDQAFVTDLGRSTDALAVARAIVQLAHSLDLRVVAEGVETEAQRDHLLELGCDELQGFLFARPMPAASLELWAMNGDESQPLSFRESLFADSLPHDMR